MTDPARTNSDNSGSPWSLVARRSSALTAVANAAATLLGGYAIQDKNVAVAQTATIQTPFGRAPLTFADLVEKVKPAVVSVQVRNGNKKKSKKFDFKGAPDFPEDHPLNEFFKRFNQPDQNNRQGEREQRRSPSVAQGSGFIISKDGYVVTNHHVINNASEIILTLDNGDEVKAEIVGSDERTDLALLKIDSKRKDFPAVEFAAKKARVGDWVLAVGNPFGLGGTVTAGIISAHNRDIGSGPYDYLQIDAAVNRGNSGGPAFNLDGKVIGVNTAIFSPSGGNVGIAFAVPSALAQKVIAQLKDGGKVARGWLGVTIQNVSDDMALSLGMTESKGAIITKLSKKGPAAKSELEVGDVIVGIDDLEIKDSRDLARTIANYSPKTKISVKVVRDGKEETLPVMLGLFPSGAELAALQSNKVPVEPEKSEDTNSDLGLSLAPASERRGAGEEGVVIVEVDPGGKAAAKGLKAGDIILEVAGIAVAAPSDVAEGVRQAKKRGRGAVHLLVRSGGRQRFIAIPLKKT